jgi:tRNA nucleotidyltransferase (CCA-adding enzyme)
MNIYLVGGAVRDGLLGRPVSEHDWVVVGATPADLEARGYRQVGREFPVFLHPDTHEEYALARLERKTGPGYRGFTTHFSPDVTLEEDLLRRDLTINAMARDAAGALIDPYGGQRDLEARVLRHVSPAFAEDPVRILRLARFAARYAPLGFQVAPETMALMRTMVANGEAATLVPERVWAETDKALSEASPRTFFEVLHAAGALAVVFPELARLYGIPQPARWHPEIDTGLHVMLVLDAATMLSPLPRVRFAALTHDLGKGTTPAAEWPRHVGHEVRSVTLIEALAERLRVPNDYRDLALIVARHHGVCHRALELRPQTVLDLLEQCDAFRKPDRFHEFLTACEADLRGRTGFESHPYPQGQRLAKALEAARAVTLSDQDRRGLSGPDIKALIHQKRVAAITALPPIADERPGAP